MPPSTAARAPFEALPPSVTPDEVSPRRSWVRPALAGIIAVALVAAFGVEGALAGCLLVSLTGPAVLLLLGLP